MNEKELGEALLKWDARVPAPEVDPHRLVLSVLARDRRRVRSLGALAGVLWVLAAVGIPLFSYFLIEYILPKYNWLMQEIISHKEGATTEDLLGTSQVLTAITSKMGVVLVCGSVAALVAAAGATIWLVFASRRATLREVNANLAEISVQLRRLQSPASER